MKLTLKMTLMSLGIDMVASAQVERGWLGLGEPRLVEKEIKKVEYQ